MTTFTTIGKTVTCPCFNEQVTLTGKYSITDNSLNPYEAKFCYATCPIVENSKLPSYEQNEDYKYLRCINKDGKCKLLSDFPSTISLK